MSASSNDQGPDQIFPCCGEDDFTTTKSDGIVKLRIGTDGQSDGISPISVPGLLIKAAQESPEITALAVKRNDKWIKWTYKEYLDEVKIVAKAFIGMYKLRHKIVVFLRFLQDF
jgi:hypothetical protein